MTPEDLAARVAPWRRAQDLADKLVPDRDRRNRATDEQQR